MIERNYLLSHDDLIYVLHPVLISSIFITLHCYDTVQYPFVSVFPWAISTRLAPVVHFPCIKRAFFTCSFTCLRDNTTHLPVLLQFQLITHLLQSNGCAADSHLTTLQRPGSSCTMWYHHCFRNETPSKPEICVAEPKTSKPHNSQTKAPCACADRLAFIFLLNVGLLILC